MEYKKKNQDQEVTYDYKKIGKRISFERKAKKDENGKSWSQERLIQELSEKGINISRNTLSAIEQGKNFTNDFDLVLKLCEIFDCELGYLLCEKGYTTRTREKTDIVNSTGLNSMAVDALLDYKGYCNNQIQSVRNDGQNYLLFISELIKDRNMFFVIFNDVKDLLRIQNEGLNEYEQNTYYSAEEALEYKKFHAQREIMSFIEKFVGGAKYGID